MAMDDQHPFRTRDTHEAAAIVAALRCVPTLQADDQGRCWFSFTGSPDAQGVSESYWAGRLQIEARGFVRSLRELKDLIFAHRRRDGDGNGYGSRLSNRH